MAIMRILPDVTGSWFARWWPPTGGTYIPASRQALASLERLTSMYQVQEVTTGSISNRAIELLDPENGGLAVGTASLSGLEAEI